MTASTNKQPEEAAVVSTPQKTNTGEELLGKLTEIRTRYLAEMQAARDKVKQNFVKAK